MEISNFFWGHQFCKNFTYFKVAKQLAPLNCVSNFDLHKIGDLQSYLFFLEIFVIPT